MMSQHLEPKVIATDKAPAAIGPYSQAIQLGGLLLHRGKFRLTQLASL